MNGQVDMDSLSQARDGIFKELKGVNRGVKCPCCDQPVKLYKRSITSVMARELIILYRWTLDHPNQRYLKLSDHIRKYHYQPSSTRECTDFSKFKFWGFISTKGELRDDGSARNGYFAITHNGMLFVTRKIPAPAHVMVYNNTKFSESEKQVDIVKCLKKKFNYNELMGYS